MYGMKTDKYIMLSSDGTELPTNDITNLTIEKAAGLMGVSMQFVRVGLQQGLFPWGYAVKMSTHYTYYISPILFAKHTGLLVS